LKHFKVAEIGDEKVGQTLSSSQQIHKETIRVALVRQPFGASPVRDKNCNDRGKVWSDPVLEQLTIDLNAIRQKQKGNTDFRGNGAVS
jgi:hypothetical protein